jgi:GNAT superfamily N-acetyltransferase
MSDITIRALERADRPAWTDLWQAYLEFYEQDLAPEITGSLFERLLSETGHSGCVAVRDGRLIGFVHYLFHDSTWSNEATCYLEDLFVSPDLRGGGVGRKLIEAVYAAADAAPRASGKVYWHTHDHNKRARRLYDHVGTLTEFVKYERP